MALVDPSIAMGVKGIELPNQLTQYAQLAQIQGAQSANELNRFKLSAARREEDQAVSRMNALRAAGADPKQIYNALIQSGDVKGANDFMKSQRESDKSQVDLVDAKLKQSRSYLDTIDPADPNAPSMFMAWHQANHADSVLGPALEARGVTAEQSMARIQDAIQRGPAAFAQMLAQSKLGTEKFMELNKPSNTTIDQGGQKVLVQTPGMGYGAPNTVGTYADVPLPQNVEAQQTRIGKASAVNITNVQERAELAARGASLVKQYDTISEMARIGQRTLPSLESNLNILNKSDFDTGFGTETKAAAASVLGALGVERAANFATDAQTFLSNVSNAVLQKQIEQKGPQTESDAKRITLTGGQLGNTKDANKFLITVAKEQIRRDVEQRNFYDSWWKRNKTYDGAEDAWYAGEGGKSLFDRPALKEYASPTSSAAQIPRNDVGAAIPQAAVAPIYARNPATGERIMSADGGNTWQPAR